MARRFVPSNGTKRGRTHGWMKDTRKMNKSRNSQTKSTTTTTMPSYGYICLPSPSCMHGQRERGLQKHPPSSPLSKTTPHLRSGVGSGSPTHGLPPPRGQTASPFDRFYRRIQQPPVPAVCTSRSHRSVQEMESESSGEPEWSTRSASAGVGKRIRVVRRRSYPS